VELFKNTFDKELSLELNLNHPTHITIEEMIYILMSTAIKMGIDIIDTCSVLKYFQFTYEEIGQYYDMYYRFLHPYIIFKNWC
jgi:hypothetical protein